MGGSEVSSNSNFVFNSLEKDGEHQRSQPRRFEIGEIVWAKAFAYTWWPGMVSRLKKSMVLVSFYGCEKTRWFKASRVRGFEENYARMARMVGVKLRDEIEIALEELGRRMALGLMCPCRRSDSGENGDSDEGIVETKKGFEPVEVLEFVVGWGLCALVGDEEMARAVRVSAQVNAFRQYVLVCPSNKIDQEFDLKDVLKLSSDSEEEGIDGKAEELVDTCRDLVLAQPDWEYRQNVEHCSLGNETQGSDNEMPSDYSSVSDMAYGFSRELENDFPIDIHGEDHEVSWNQWQNGRQICVINRVDFSMFDLDTEEAALPDDQPDTFDVVDMDNSCSVISPVELIKEDVCARSNCVEVVDQSSDIVTECRANERLACYDAFHILEEKLHLTNLVGQTWEKTLGNSPLATLDVEELNQHNDVVTVAEDGHSPALLMSSSELDKCSQQSPYLPTCLASISYPESPSQLSSCIEPQSGDKVRAIVCCNKADETGIMSICTSSASPPKIAHASIPKKMQLNQVLIANNILRLQKIIAPFAEDMRDSCPVMDSVSFIGHSCNAYPVMDCLSSIGNKTSNGEDVAAHHVTEETLVLAIPENNLLKDTNADEFFNLSNRKLKRACDARANDSLALAVSVAKGTSKQKLGLDQPNIADPSKWRRYYASPLARDVLKSSTKAQRSLADKRCSCPRSLHMKFPKGFNLPSKEELEKSFEMFGPLDCSRTRIFSFTGAARVVFLQRNDAHTAYESVRKKNVFGVANVRFWLDEFEDLRNSHNPEPSSVSIKGRLLPTRKKNVFREDCRKDKKSRDLSMPRVGEPSSARKEKLLGETKVVFCPDKNRDLRKVEKALDIAVPTVQSPNLKSCLKRSGVNQERARERPCRVRFIMETG